MSSYLSDYLHAHSGTECPTTFIRWSALALLGHLVGRKIYYDNRAFKVQIPLYTCLIGPSGEGKSTAKDWMKDILQTHFPTELFSANAQTPGDIIKLMAEDQNCKSWKNKATGQLEFYHSFFIIANEFKAFLHNDPIGMINFVVDIYGQKEYADSYKNAGRNKIPFPHLSIVACATPELITKDLKIDIVAGGLGRRFNLAIDNKNEFISEPTFPIDRKETLARVIDHLKRVNTEEIQGAFHATPEARKWYNGWYGPYMHKVPDNSFLAIAHKTNHEMMLRIATLLSLSEYDIKHEVTEVHMQAALQMIEETHPNIIKMSQGMGRNEIAQFGQQMMDLLRRMNGAMPKDKVLLVLGANLRYAEFEEQVNVLKKTQGIIEATIGAKAWLITEERYKQMLEQQKQKDQPPE